MGRKIISLIVTFVIGVALIPTTIFADLYRYDTDSRLKSELFINNGIQYQRSYTYDPNGNLMGKTSSSNDFLLLESSFETRNESENFKYPSSVFSISSNEAKEGQHSLYFHASQPTIVTAESFPLEVTPNTLYTLSGWIKNSLNSGSAYIDWMEYNANDQLIYDGGTLSPTAKDQWQNSRLEFTTKSGTAKVVLRIVLDSGAMGAAFFDDIRFEKGKQLPISKATFETNEVPWYSNIPSNYFSITGYTAKVGRQSLQFHSDQAVTVTAECGEFIVEPNSKYSLSGWINKDLKTGNTYIDWMEYDNTGNLVYDGGAISAIEKRQWQYDSLEFITKPSTSRLVLRIVADENATGSAYYDNIELRKGSTTSLMDSSFEFGDDLWHSSSPQTLAVATGNAKDGIRSMRFHSSSPVVSFAEYGRLVVEPNTKYALSGWIYNALVSGSGYIDWVEYDADGNMIYDGGTIYFSEKNQWKFGSLEFVTKSQTQSIVIRIVADSGAAGDAYFDKIIFSKAQ